MPKRIIYIPRPRIQAGEPDAGNLPSLISQAETWKKIIEEKEGKNYTFYVKCLDEKLPGEPNDDDQVYIYAGHGLPGVDGAGWPGDPGKLTNQVVVTSEQIADRISDEGWSPSLFGGKIKIYVCHSAAKGSGNTEAFASLVAKKMLAKGWAKCRFFGYNAQVTQTYSALKSIQAKGLASRLEVDVTTLQGMHRWSVSGSGVTKMTQGRASGHRTEF